MSEQANDNTFDLRGVREHLFDQTATRTLFIEEYF